VDPGVTARLELLLDEVLVGKQRVEGAIDAVCDQAARIIGRLVDGTGHVAECGAEPIALPGPAAASGTARRPPSPAMRKFVEGVAARLKVKPPSGYTNSADICRRFLDHHAPKRPSGRDDDRGTPTSPTAALLAFAEKIAQEKSVAISDEATADKRSLSARIDANGGAGRRPSRGRSRSRKPGAAARPSSRAPGPTRTAGGVEGTALRIPFGNKAAAMGLGARYGKGGWYAPPGTDLGPFRERGWL
jgi:DNA topoisomerase-3